MNTGNGKRRSLAARVERGTWMGRKKWIGGFAALVAVSVSMWAGLSSANAAPAKHSSQKLDKVTLQLKWVTQSQFAGYYAAKALGYYKQFGLDVTLKVGGPDVTPEQVVASGQAQIGIDWLPSLLATRDTGTDLVNIAQMAPRSGMTELTWKSSGINSIAAMKGKTVGVWCCGNQFELYAALTKHGMDPEHNKGVKIFNQPFDMKAFVSHQIDAAAAMTYNELAQVLETKNPKTGKLFTLADLNVFKMQDQGTGMLEDGLFTTSDWLQGHRDVAMRVIAASDRGWIYCRDHYVACTTFVLKNGPTLGKGHQLWETNEMNALIWPNKLGIGVMDPAAFNRTAAIALKYKVIKKAAAPSAAYDHTLGRAALAYLENKVPNIDVHGNNWKKATVAVTAGGK
jgi:NitT/TauT family transport system substrate-binding protein